MRKLLTLLTIVLLGALSGPVMAGQPGSKLFTANCAGCHGRGGKGDGPGARSMKPKPRDLTQSKLSLQQIMAIVRNGKSGCPSWRSSMNKSEIEAVSKHAKGLQR